MESCKLGRYLRQVRKDTLQGCAFYTLSHRNNKFSIPLYGHPEKIKFNLKRYRPDIYKMIQFIPRSVRGDVHNIFSSKRKNV